MNENDGKTPGDVQGASEPKGPKFTRTDIQNRLGDAFAAFAAQVQALTIDIPKDKEHNRRTVRAIATLAAQYGVSALGMKGTSAGHAASEAGGNFASEAYKKEYVAEHPKPDLSVVDGGEETDESEEDGGGDGEE